MAVTSAGIVLYRYTPALEVFLAHMGGPFWARKQSRAWSIPKGEYVEGSETALAAAQREFQEEIGVTPPKTEYEDLGRFRYSAGKTLRVFAAQAEGFDVEEVRSSTFELEWPPRSGRIQTYPEIDEARWVGSAEARDLLVAGQVPVLDALEARR